MQPFGTRPRRTLVPTGLAAIAFFILALAANAATNPVLGVVTSTRTYSIGPVDAKPEAGPMIVVDGDKIAADTAVVMFRLTGQNRAILGTKSEATVRPIPPQRDAPEVGQFFYLSKGSIQYDALKEPLAICARDRLYLPSIPGSGEVVIVNDKPQVRLITGTMVRSGSDVCNNKGAAWLLSNGAGSPGTVTGTAGAAGIGSPGAVTATAAGAGIQAGVPVAVSIGVSTGTVAGMIGTAALSQSPPSASPTLPGQ